MSLIQCDDDCIYQKDGYCQLDAPTVITNSHWTGVRPLCQSARTPGAMRQSAYF